MMIGDISIRKNNKDLPSDQVKPLGPFRPPVCLASLNHPDDHHNDDDDDDDNDDNDNGDNDHDDDKENNNNIDNDNLWYYGWKFSTGEIALFCRKFEQWILWFLW